MNSTEKQQEESELEYTLDVFKFDNLILGTGLTEQLLVSSLQKIGKQSCLVLDIDDGYSSSLKTQNLKEIDELQSYKQSQSAYSYSQKSTPYSPIELPQDIKSLNEDFYGVQNENKKYKNYNIDLQPKLIFSSSLATTLMSQADLDKYLEFKAVTSIYHYDNKQEKFILAPSSKGDIFKSSDLSLLEKKQMFTLLHTMVKFANVELNYQADQNSTNEFDQDFNIDESKKQLYAKYKYINCLEFLKEFTQNQKIIDIFLYTLCNYEYNPAHEIPLSIKSEYITSNFLKRLSKFVRSCGIHTKLPYLYTNYGTGDIPQVFSRIAAVFGSIYIINRKIKITKITKAENEEYYKIYSNLAGKKEFIEVKKIIMGTEYQQHVQKVSQINLELEKEDELQMLRINIITEKEKKFKKVPISKKAHSQKEENKQLQDKELHEQVAQQPEKPKQEEEGGQSCDEKQKNAEQKQKVEETENAEEDKQKVGDSQKSEEEQKQKVEETENAEQKQKVEETENAEQKQKVGDSQKSEEEDKQKVGDSQKSKEEFQIVEEVDENMQKSFSQLPHLLIIPPYNPIFENIHPIHIFQLDSNTMSCPDGQNLFQVKMIIPSNLYKNSSELSNYISQFVLKLKNFIVDFDKLKGCANHRKHLIQYMLGFKQSYFGYKNKTIDNVTVLQESNYDLDLDKNFDEYKSLIPTLSNNVVQIEHGNFYKSIDELNGKQNQEDDNQEAQNQPDDSIENLLKKFDKINVSAQSKPEEKQMQDKSTDQ